jgi:hypothetical protein
MIGLHCLFPVYRIIPDPWNLLGLVPLAVDVILNLSSDRAFKEAETTGKSFQESKTLVTDDAFRITRNPMHLGFALVVIGVAILLGSVTPWVVVALFTILLDQAYMDVEERMMAEQFGSDWSRYAERTRRWAQWEGLFHPLRHQTRISKWIGGHMARQGEKLGWVGGWVGAFLWVVGLSIFWLVQGRILEGLVLGGVFLLALALVLILAPWRHPYTRYWKLMLPIYAIFVGSIFLTVWWAGALKQLGLAWWLLLWLMPTALPFLTMGGSRWEETDT